MSTPVTFNFNPTPAPACYPSDVNGLAELLTTGGVLSGSVPANSGGGVYVGVTPPSSSLTYQVWFKTDGIGRPIGAYMFYSGNWRKVWTGVGIGEIRFYNGNPANFDGTGLGVVGGDLDGWALCNGNNGTANLQNYFVCGSTTAPAGWQANPSGLGSNANSGGVGSHTIGCSNLPDLYATAFQTPVASGTGTLAASSQAGGANAWDIPVMDLINNCHPQGQNPLDNTPPWVAFAMIQFIGY